MDKDSVYRQFTQLMREVFDDDQLTPGREMTAQDIEGWDSARMIDLITSVEIRFNVQFSTRQIDRLRTVNDFLDLIEETAA